MAETIADEARRSIKLETDVDNYRRVYYVEQSGYSVRYVSPWIETYEKFRYTLLQNSETRDIGAEYIYRPDYLSYDVYGTTDLWPLLLFINNIPSIEDFTIESVVVPNYSTILAMAEFSPKDLDPIDIESLKGEVPSTGENKKLNLFNSNVKPSADPEPIEVDGGTDVTCTTFTRQKFTLRAVDINNKFVDLAYDPVLENIDLKLLNNSEDLLYNVHFRVKLGTTGKYRRLTWSTVDNTDGDGLESLLVVGDVIEVKYAREF